MALLGTAALAMWWDIAPEWREEFEHWHTHEHFPERLGIPGFLRASRFAQADGGEGFFILYELASHDVLGSPAYAARLNAPTPWSKKLMPHHRNMVRTQCRVLGSAGGIAARHVLTFRLAQAQDDVLAALSGQLRGLAQKPGLAGVHVLKHQPPALAPTTEQKIRGLADGAAAAAVVIAGHDRDALQTAETVLLNALPAGVQRGAYSLSLSMAAGDPA
ncbi:DUF4286 family protein [Ramlibacter humi]|uniref:Uncharacterized protein n=1 Tax=Ramlibacter humi TaxID=2530451 RepID=A0A4Z0BG39_9BURK|nr:DUF4286 family protein [Ramlibacter humi]TFY97691.1 hypothetical protein EZ216_18370 [Ramlibacter humi]